MSILKKVNLFLVMNLMLIPLVHADFKSDIIDSCSQYQNNDGGEVVNACKLYIDGFIDASMEYDTNANIEVKSDFIRRVYRTRNVSGDLGRRDNVPDFCLPIGESRQLITSTIAKSIDLTDYDTIGFTLSVHQALVNKYPC